MVTRSGLVGRRAEREWLQDALESAREGRGSLVLVAGEAGVGKTRLVEEVAAGAGGTVLWGRAGHGAAAPYGPVVAALRAQLRSAPGCFDGCGALLPHLALILPELGDPAPAGDRPTLFEAVRQALAELARDGPALVVLDDLQASDDATLELLSALAEPLAELPILMVAAYRSDGLPRDHTLRRLRHDLRRGGRLAELTVPPFEPEETGELLARILGDEPGPLLASTVHDRTQGVSFFVEELARALLLTGSLTAGRRGLELAEAGEVPVPETVRDAVLIGAAELSEDARAAADAAAVAGDAFDLDMVAEVSSAAGLGELVERDLVVETGPGVGAFRHALVREALYADVPWMRRRALHRRLAEALAASGAGSIEVATHWLGSRELSRAREWLVRAAEESRGVHAYRDAVRAGRQALDLWPEGADEDARVEVLESYASSAELSGELAEAARAWREICAVRAGGDAREEYAAAQRRLAAVHDLKGDRDSALAARREAAEAYAAGGRPAEAAVERLAMGNYMRASASYSAAIELAEAAAADADRAGRLDLGVRARGLEGVARAKRGEFEAGLETVRDALAVALENDLTASAADLYQRLSLVLYDGADYRRAQETLASALELCRATDEPGTETACVTCMVYVLRECGEWREALALGRDLVASGTAVWVAEGLMGVIHCLQGKLSSARQLLSSSHAAATRVGHFNMSVDTTAGLARLAAAEGATDEAAERCRSLMARWEQSEDHHYAVKGLRFGAGFFARQGDLGAAHACAEALTGISSETGHADALAALAHAIAEAALADGDAGTAAEQLGHAVELHRGLDLPYDRAEIELRAGVALAAAGDRELALERLGDAYRTARKLGARPLAAEAAREVAALGESVARRLGRRAEADADGAGLSRRELEVVRLVAVGRTNREIAQELFLSPRTVDMHVRNILRKLDSRSRVEAAHRAGELGLLP
ncbi:MAG TPA: AAA family ATPase [Thermoleophilaceae bacterium]|jgi:DNA-binding CsgD family transcriptional regulator